MTASMCNVNIITCDRNESRVLLGRLRWVNMFLMAMGDCASGGRLFRPCWSHPTVVCAAHPTVICKGDMEAPGGGLRPRPVDAVECGMGRGGGR